MNSESPNTSSPTVAQFHDARLKRWHQTGEALLTAENLRSWINASGLVLFAPRPQIVAPAPTFLEAVLGAPAAEPALQSINEARALLARLAAEGVAVPLNLMGTSGTPGDTPDFVASAAVFSYIFTLRGDKAWKQPPVTSGPLKVSNLAVATYEALSSKGAMSAYDLATQLGKEVTEAACLRALNELWTHLRVLPVTQPDRATIWELTSTRFSKQIKAGANAGLPSAVSALISLYLGQVMAATEEEIESFLSPLAPRSRIREVAHALLNARQLETLVIEGKTLLHVAGEAPSFVAPEEIPAEVEVSQAGGASDGEAGEGAPRITKYIPQPRKIGTGYLAKGKPAAGKRPFNSSDPRRRSEGFKPRGGGRDDRERRPFQKPAASSEGAQARRFDRPWNEERPRRIAEGGSRPVRKSPFRGEDQAAERREFRGSRPPRREEGRPERRPRGDDRDFARRPRVESDQGFERRPRRDSEGGAAARPFQKRPERRDRDARPPRKKGGEAPGQDRPVFRRFDVPRREDRPKRPRRQGDGAERRESARNSDRRPPRREEGSGTRPQRREGGFGDRPAKKQGSNRPFGKAKFGGGPGKFAKSTGKKKPFQKKPSDRTFRPRRDESA